MRSPAGRVPTSTRSPIRTLASFALVGASLVGCGFGGADDRMRARAEIGVPDGRTLQVAESEYVCSRLVSIQNERFRPSVVRDGEAHEEAAFGPFVPCGTVVTGDSGLCPNCNEPYHRPGASPIAVCPNIYVDPEANRSDDFLVEVSVAQCDEELGAFSEGKSYGTCRSCDQEVQIPRSSVPVAAQLRCPYEDCGKVIDPTAVQLKETEARQVSRFQPGQCPHCQEYFEAQPSDVLEVIEHPEQLVCPQCEQPVDPSLNACTNARCDTGGVVRNVDAFQGPCWRCGGVKVCPECGGSGLSPQLPSGEGMTALPPGCWYCMTVTDPTTGAAESTGRCPECDWTGFSTYEGSLPAGFRTHSSGRGGPPKVVPSAERSWEFTGGGDPPAQPSSP